MQLYGFYLFKKHEGCVFSVKLVCITHKTKEKKMQPPLVATIMIVFIVMRLYN